VFKPTNPDKIVQQQLYEARRLRLEHQVHAEYHQAMAEMLKARIDRLESDAVPARRTIEMAGGRVYADSPGLVSPVRKEAK
jgi:hypothetical protein